MLLVAAGSVVFQSDQSILGERMKGLIQFTYSLIIAYSLFLELSRWERGEIADLFFYSCILILIGCALEHTTPLKAVSDAFRAVAFKTGVYGNVARDVNIFGVERPKLFTSEPSHVAKFLLLAMTVWFALSRGRGRLLTFALIGIAGFLLIGSPILLLAFFTGGLVILYVEIGGIKRLLLRPRLKNSVLLFTFFLVGGLLLALALQTRLAGRVSEIAAGRELSFSLRTIAPVLLTYDAIQDNPAWGIGITGKQAAEESIRRRFAQLNIDVVTLTERLFNQMSNSFWLHWAYLGLLGGTLMLLLICRLMNKLGVRHTIYCLFTMAILAQTMGAYVGARTWTFFFLIFLTSMTIARQRHHDLTAPDVGKQPRTPS
jgi:hypothetical protein